MTKIDRLGWAAAACFEAYGVRVGIRVNSLEILPLLPSLLPPGAKPTASPVVDQMYSLWLGGRRTHVRGFHLLYAGVARRARSMSLHQGLETLEADLRLTVAAAARRRVFVHAG